VLLGSGLTGLIVGWAIRPVSLDLDAATPRVTWLQVGGLFLVAGVLAIVARATHRALQQRRELLTPREAVNRLVLAKACAVAGALFVGGYLGHALSWFGVGAEHSGAYITMSLLAGVGAALVVLFALLLERACRVREDDEEP
jgi:hypothetical protein